MLDESVRMSRSRPCFGAAAGPVRAGMLERRGAALQRQKLSAGFTAVQGPVA